MPGHKCMGLRSPAGSHIGLTSHPLKVQLDQPVLDLSLLFRLFDPSLLAALPVSASTLPRTDGMVAQLAARLVANQSFASFSSSSSCHSEVFPLNKIYVNVPTQIKPINAHPRVKLGRSNFHLRFGGSLRCRGGSTTSTSPH